MQNEQGKKRKVLYILLALLAAISMWIYADEFGNNGGHRLIEKTITDIPVNYNGEIKLADRGLMLLEDETTTTLDVTVKGGRRQVSRLEQDDITINVDLSNVEKAGVQQVPCTFSYDDDKFSNDMSRKPSSNQVTVNISELNRRIVDIRCELSGHVADGYSAGQLQMSQDTLEIRGQAKDIDPVSYVKVVLDVGDGAEETVSQELTFQYYDKNNQQLNSANIHPTVDSVQVTLPVFVTKELRLVVDFKESPGARKSNLDYEIKPEYIVVSGDAAALRNIETITLGELDLLDLLNGGPRYHTYPIIIPDGCQNLSGVPRATLDVSVADMTSAEGTTQQFTYADLPSGKRVDVLTQELTVRVFGTTADVEAITGEQITVVADLTNYSAASGTYTVPAVIEVASGAGDVGVSGNYQVQVRIREPHEPLPEEPTEEPEQGAEATPEA